MILLQKFYNRQETTDHAEMILLEIFDTLLYGRKEFSNDWDILDDEEKEKILTENLKIIKRDLMAA